MLLATTLPKREFECVKRTGEITTKDGRIVGIEEISAMPVRQFEDVIRTKTARPRRHRENRSPQQAKNSSEIAELHQLLHDLEEGLLKNVQHEDYEKWKGELRRIYADVIKNEASHATDGVQASALDGRT